MMHTMQTQLSKHRSRLYRAIMLLSLLLAAVLISQSQAQTSTVYFQETGHYLGGTFRTFWEANGGVNIFGYPITEEYVAPNGRITQYFERARFEVAGPDMVELGRLGAEVSADRVFPQEPRCPESADYHYVEETGYAVRYGFKEIWQTRGAERIFGYPISEEIDELLDNGEWHTVQYFERARFEYWPDFPPGERVLISTLGRRLAPAELVPPLPPNAPPGAPAPVAGAPPAAPAAPLPAMPADMNAQVIPKAGPPGTTFGLQAWGFKAKEMVGIWLRDPMDNNFGVDFGDGETRVRASEEGTLDPSVVFIISDENYPDGIWGFNAQGVESEHQAVGYFVVDRALPPVDPPAGAPTAVPPTATPAPGQPTATPAPAEPTPTATPEREERTCEETEPDEREGATAWMTEPNPLRDTETTACARLIIAGDRKGNEDVTFEVRYEDDTDEYEDDTNEDGIASVTFNIGDAEQGREVKVYVEFEGGDYDAETEFLPH